MTILSTIMLSRVTRIVSSTVSITASPMTALADVNAISRKLITTLLLGIMLIWLFIGMGITSAVAAIDVYEFDTPQQEAQYRQLIDELRCPKCQNQNLAGSDSLIAQDLKRKTYTMVMDGRSDDEIRDYMYERYGAFISYKPPVTPATWILWFFPPLILLLLLAWWLWRNAKATQRQAVAVGLDAQALPIDDVYQAIESAQIDKTTSSQTTSGLTDEESKALNNLLDKYDHMDDGKGS